MTTDASGGDALYAAFHRLVRARHANPVARLRHAAGLLSWPLRAVLSIFPDFWEYGPALARAGGPSLGRQFAYMWRQALRDRRRSLSYYQFRLHRPEAQLRVRQWLDPHVIEEIERALFGPGGRRSELADKRAFALACAAQGLPTPPILAEFVGGKVRWWGEPNTLPEADLFAKNMAGMCGASAACWTYAGGRRWRHGGGTHDRDGLVAELCRLSLGRPRLLQPRLMNHPTIRPLTTGGLCTVRVVTMRFPGAPVEPLLSAFRMAAGGADADNFAAGGLAAPVDLSTGTLGPAVRKATVAIGTRYDRHPDTGALITGARLPSWEDVVPLCLRAHEMIQAARVSIGWDVALTPDGPILLEVNGSWCFYLAQCPSDRPLGETRLVDCYLAHLAARGLA